MDHPLFECLFEVHSRPHDLVILEEYHSYVQSFFISTITLVLETALCFPAWSYKGVSV